MMPSPHQQKIISTAANNEYKRGKPPSAATAVAEGFSIAARSTAWRSRAVAQTGVFPENVGIEASLGIIDNRQIASILLGNEVVTSRIGLDHFISASIGAPMPSRPRTRHWLSREIFCSRHRMPLNGIRQRPRRALDAVLFRVRRRRQRTASIFYRRSENIMAIGARRGRRYSSPRQRRPRQCYKIGG